MVYMRELWKPILLSSVAAFGASSVIWMVLGYHKTDVAGVPEEDVLRDALRRQSLGPGQYAVPFVADPKQRTTPEFLKKLAEGPHAFITLNAPGVPNMGRMLGRWFVYLFLLNSIIAYVSGRTFPHSMPFLTIFRTVAVTAWLAYGGALPVFSIFWGRPWRVTWKEVFDAFLYACLTAASFAWLWPTR
jgi:hypothetical protein